MGTRVTGRRRPSIPGAQPPSPVVCQAGFGSGGSSGMVTRATTTSVRVRNALGENEVDLVV